MHIIFYSTNKIHNFYFSSRRRHTRYIGDWSSDVCSSDLACLSLNHNSTWLSHEPCLGVKWKTCLCVGSHRKARRCTPRRRSFATKGTLHHWATRRQTARLQWVLRLSTTQS